VIELVIEIDASIEDFLSKTNSSRHRTQASGQLTCDDREKSLKTRLRKRDLQHHIFSAAVDISMPRCRSTVQRMALRAH